MNTSYLEQLRRVTADESLAVVCSGADLSVLVTAFDVLVRLGGTAAALAAEAEPAIERIGADIQAALAAEVEADGPCLFCGSIHHTVLGGEA